MKHRQENNETSTAFFLKNKIYREVQVIRKQWINFFSQSWLRTVDNKNNRTPNPRRPSVILFFKRHRKRETCSLKNKLWRKWLEEEILSFYRWFCKWGAGRIRAECTVIGLESFGKLWAFQGLDNFEWMSGREIDRVEIPPTIHFSRCRGGHSFNLFRVRCNIFMNAPLCWSVHCKDLRYILNLKYPKELNESIIAINLGHDHTRLLKDCLTNFSVEITCFGWVKWNCSAG